ncbi:MAG: PAAR domain-containing protein [Polyangia bacterium]|jgi:uncharacterized Zn-binding protein involved in type VI secretion
MPGQGRLGDKSNVPACVHGCLACPHPAVGPAIVGSPNVLVNNLPALRLGDNGIHAVCCGPNTWTAVKGSATVMINNKPAHRMGDTDQHCGGVGQLIEGSPTVIVGG